MSTIRSALSIRLRSTVSTTQIDAIRKSITPVRKISRDRFGSEADDLSGDPARIKMVVLWKLLILI